MGSFSKLPLFPYYDGAFYGPSPKKLPLYTEEYLNYWEEMLVLLGEKYDKKTSLEYVDISGFGLWGEGHHGCNPTADGPVVNLELGGRERMEEVVERLIISHKRAFPLTPMVLNLTLSQYRAGAKAIQEGCWVRRDSYYRWFQADETWYGLNRKPNTAMIFETVMPGIGMQDSADPAYRQSFMNTPDKMCDYGATYGIVGFNILDTLYADHMMPELFEPFQNRLGYRLRPSIVWKQKKTDGSQSLVLGMVNDGCANPPGTLCFQAESGDKQSCVRVSGEYFGKKMCLVTLPLPKDCKEEVALSLSLEIGEKKENRPFCGRYPLYGGSL